MFVIVDQHGDFFNGFRGNPPKPIFSGIQSMILSEEDATEALRDIMSIKFYDPTIRIKKVELK